MQGVQALPAGTHGVGTTPAKAQLEAVEASSASGKGTSAAPERERINVCVRLRPLSSTETARRDRAAWHAADDATLRCDADTSSGPGSRASLHGKAAAWSFDRVFDTGCSGQEVYDAAFSNIVQSAMDGVNASIMAYGPTGSGKTYTMRGVMQAAAPDLFHRMGSSGREYLIHASAVEIYNEIARDMLLDGCPALAPGDGMKLHQEPVQSPEHLLELLQTVEKRRQVRETAANDSSSRSHQIFRLRIESREAAEGDEAVFESTLDFVDLAGSERSTDRDADKSSTDGSIVRAARLKEGVGINLSLLTLGKVIRALGEERQGHVPYRDSKLTRLLQGTLSGNSRTAIIVTLSPSSAHVEASRGALRFAEAAKKVPLAPSVNEVLPERALIRRLQAEISELRARLEGDAREHENAALREGLRATEEQAALSQQQRQDAEKRLRGLEKLILRGAPGAMPQVRASWSPAVSGASLLTPPRASAGAGSAAGGRGRPSLLSMSWNPGAEGVGSTRKHLFGQAPSGAGPYAMLLPFADGDAAGEPRPVAKDAAAAAAPSKARAAPADAADAAPAGDLIRSAAQAGGGASAGAATGADTAAVVPTWAGQGADPEREREALAELQAQVAVAALKQRAEAGGGAAADAANTNSGTSGREAEIEALQAQLRKMEEDAVIGKFLDDMKHSAQMSALRLEIDRLSAEQRVEASALHALASLEEKLATMPDGEEGYEEAEAALLGASQREDGEACSVAGGEGTPDSGPRDGGSEADGPPEAVPYGGAPPRPPALDVGASCVDDDADMPNMDSPIVGAATGKENAGLPPRVPSLVARAASTPVLSPNARAAAIARVQRSASDKGPVRSSTSSTPPGRHPAEVIAWYKRKIAAERAVFKESAERDVASLREVVKQYSEQKERLECQKKLLVQQVLTLEAHVKELSRNNEQLGRQLLAAKKELADLQLGGAPPVPEAMAAPLAPARSALPAAPSGRGQLPACPPLPSPLPSPMRAYSGASSGFAMAASTDWAAAPTNEALLQRIVELWELLHVPLLHRSRFYLLFRGRETFYFEAEHRRLSSLKSRLVPEEEGEHMAASLSGAGSNMGSPRSRAQNRRKLQAAKEKLDWERKYLAAQLKQEFSEADRDELFLEWNIHRSQENRKLKLIKKLWSENVIAEPNGMERSSVLVLRLNHDDPADAEHEMVFGKTQGDSWARSLLNTGGTVMAPLIHKVKAAASNAGRNSLQRKSGFFRGLSSRRNSISSFAGWGDVREGSATPSQVPSAAGTPR